MPSWEFSSWGHTIPFMIFVPAVIFPGLIFTLCGLWPAIERRFTGDNEIHHLLDRPRDRPKRTAAGAAMLALMFTLLGASATDVLANFFQVSLNEVLWTFRFLVFIVPIVVGVFTWRICIEMQGGGADIGKRKRAVIMTRSATGEYHTQGTEPQPDDERPELAPVPVPVHIDLEAPVGANGGTGGTGVRTVTR